MQPLVKLCLNSKMNQKISKNKSGENEKISSTSTLELELSSLWIREFFLWFVNWQNHVSENRDVRDSKIETHLGASMWEEIIE